MSLEIKRAAWTGERVLISFSFTCNACGAVEERIGELCVRPHEGKRVIELPHPPASWRTVEERHYCSRHEVRVKLVVIENPKQTRLPLEGTHGDD